MKFRLFTFAFSPYWGRQSLFVAPFQRVNSTPKYLTADPKFFRPLAKALSLVAQSQHTTVRSIPGLLNLGSPSAVAWFVVAIYLFAVEAVFRRGWFTHVSQECLKAVSPSTAYFNPPASVVRPSFIRWVEAPYFHVVPGNVSLGSAERYNTFSHILFTVGNWLGLGSCFQHGPSLPPNYTKGAAW